MDLKSFQPNNILSIIFSSLTIFIGIFGNALNLMVFTRKSMRKATTFRFLFYLSLVNFFVLLICATDTLLTFGFNLQIRLFNSLTCSMHTFLTYFLTQMSSLILMIVNIERLFIVCNKTLISALVYLTKNMKKHDRTAQCDEKSSDANINTENVNNRIRKYKYTVEMKMFFVSMFLLAINFHFVIYMNLNEFNLFESFSNFKSDELNVQNYTPSVINTVKISNVYRILRTSNFNLDQVNFFELKSIINSSSLRISSVELEQNNALIYVCYPVNNPSYSYFLTHIWLLIDVSIYCLIPFLVMALCSLLILFEINKKNKEFIRKSFRQNRQLSESKEKRQKQLFYLLIASNVYFVLTSFPYCITFSSFNRKKDDDNEISFLQSLINIFAYSNNALNFFFYGLFSEKYRKELFKIFKEKKPLNRSFSLTNSHYTKNSDRSHSIVTSSKKGSKIEIVQLRNMSVFSAKSAKNLFNHNQGSCLLTPTPHLKQITSLPFNSYCDVSFGISSET